VLLLAPQTPLLFMGQEWGRVHAVSCYFTDHNQELGRLIAEGRRNEFGHFSAVRRPDPAAEAHPRPATAGLPTSRGKLNWV